MATTRMVDAHSRRRVLASVLAGGTFTLAGCSQLPLSDSTTSAGGPNTWPAQGFDAANTGYNPAATGVPEHGVKRWFAEWKEPRPFVVADGTLYTRWRARDIGSGSVSFDIANAARRGTEAVPTYHDGVIYMFDSGPAAFDAIDGRQRWRNDAFPLGFWHPPTVTADALYGARADTDDEPPTLYSFALGSGDVLWTAQLPANATFAPLVTDGVLLVMCWEKELERYSLVAFSTDGERLWTETVSGSTFEPPTAGDGAIFALENDTIVAFEVDSGEIRWEREYEKALPGFCYGDGLLYAWTGELSALRASDGTTEWTVEEGGTPMGVGSDAIYSYGPSFARELIVIERASREVTWTYEFPMVTRGDIYMQGAWDHPALVDGALFVPAADGLYAFEPA